jgi:uncharacterized repeat protein (TIGR01451 family)
MTASSSLRPLSILILAIMLVTHALTAAAQGPAGTLQKTAIPIDGNGDGAFEVDETIQYTLTFTNSGTVDLTGVVVRDASSGCVQLDIGSVVIEPTTGGTSSSSGNDVQVDLQSPLMPGEVVTITFVGSAMVEGSCCNQATWSSAEVAAGVSDRDPQDATPDQPTCHVASALPGPETDAIIDKQVLTAGCLEPGSVVDFRVRIQNTGRRPLRNAAFEDVLDPAFANVVVDAGLTYDPVAHRVYVDPRTYGVGEETGYTYRVELPCTESGTLTNTARLTFEDQAGNVLLRSDSETVTWGRPDLWSSTKRWHDDPADADGIVSPGENLTFTITVRNTGLCEAIDIAVSDPLDVRLVATAPELVVQDGGVYDPATRTIAWSSATTPQLAALQTESEIALTFTTQVEPGTVAGFIPNTAFISVLGNDPGGCMALPSLARSLVLQNGDVAYGGVVATDTLLRNDSVSCLKDAFRTVRGDYPVMGTPPILSERPSPQECSNPSAINAAHPETDALVNPTSPTTFVGDAAARFPQCPQASSGSGRLLVFYELLANCTTTLRVTKDPASPTDVVVTW